MTLLEKILDTESISEAHKLIRSHLLQEDLKSDKSNYARYKAAMKVISKKATSPEYLNYAWIDAEGYQYFTDTRLSHAINSRYFILFFKFPNRFNFQNLLVC